MIRALMILLFSALAVWATWRADLSSSLATRALRAVVLLAALTSVALAVSACASKPPDNLGVVASGELRPCGPEPNCVSSTADDDGHRVEPFPIDRPWSEARAILIELLEQHPRATLVTADERYLHAEFRTRVFGFVDDVEFLIRPDESLLDVRSQSRIGYSDLGTNRRRVESLREDYLARCREG